MENIKWRKHFNRINNVDGGDGLQMLSIGAIVCRVSSWYPSRYEILLGGGDSGRQADKALPCKTRKLWNDTQKFGFTWLLWVSY